MRKLAEATGVILLILLALFPFVFKMLSLNDSITLRSSDMVIVHLVFIFANIAGILTWAENKHISLDVINRILPDKMRRFTEPVISGLTTAILTALFFTAFSELFMAFQPGDRLWGIPYPVIFLSLPLMYFAMLFMAVKRRPKKIASILGIIFGILISTGPLSGILYYLHLPSPEFLQTIFNAWISATDILVWPLVIILIIGALFGMPIFLVFSGIAYVAFSKNGGYVEVIALESYNMLIDKNIATIPLFTLAGYLLAEGSAGKRLLEVVKSSVGWIKGGPVIATVIVATFFTTFTGASGVTILALGSLLTIILTGSGYKQEKAESLVTASGSIGLLFPPSLAIIIYGSTNIYSVEMFDLFKGGIIPGILLALSMIIIGIVQGKSTVERTRFSGRQLWDSLKGGFAELLMPIGIVILYFSGIFSLIETAAFAALYAFILEVVIRKDLTLKASLQVILKSIPVAGGVLIIIGAAKGLAYFMIDAGIPYMLTEFVISFVHSKYLFLFLLNILLLVVGCIMDLYSAILVVSPLIIPIAESFGINSVHLGIIFLSNLALGFLTPPVGLNLFIASYTFDKPVMKIAKNILPYLLVQFVILMLITYVPWFSTALL
ncbi:TRAP transporter large permease subunit [Brucepastera parasyntrophica]|uniref:TRAP transporter large permease subunit n=1 Tax=Brucepastera parasyntrophica TaxID=2880008 RepID=UPI003F7130D7